MPRLRLNGVCILLSLVCASLVGISQGQSLSVLGQKTIRPFAPYTVTVTNTLSKNVQLQLNLMGYDMDQTKSILLKRESEQRITFETRAVMGDGYSLSIRSLDPSVIFSEEVPLITDPRSFSIFIQIDKPIYKPGDILNFRVIVVDSDTRPVTNLSHVEVSLEDSADTSIRAWKYAKLRNGVFESSVQLPSSPNLGVWNLTVESDEFQVKKFKEFEVKPYILPKFWIKVYPTEVPLLERKSIKLTVESEFTFGRPVTGKVQVDLYLEKLRRVPDHSARKNFERIATFDFSLSDEVDIDSDMDFHDVFVNVTVTETHTNTTLFVLEPIRVYRNEFDILLSKPWPTFRPGMPFPMQIAFKDRNGRAAGKGQRITYRITYRHIDDREVESELYGIINDKGMLSLEKVVPPATAEQMIIQMKYQSVDFEAIIDGVKSISNQYLRITLPDKYKIRPNKEVQFEIVCSEPMTYLTYVLVARGVIVDSNLVKAYRRKKYSLRYKLKPILAPKARIIVFYTNKEFMIWDELELSFETFENNFKFFMDENKYNPGQESYIDVEAAPDSFVAFHAIDQSVLFINGTIEWNDLTRANIEKEFESFNAENNEFDHFHSIGLFLRTTSKKDSAVDRMARYGLGYPVSRKNIIHIRTVFPETWLWKNLTMDGRTETTFMNQIPDTITSWLVTGFALSPTTGLGIINEPLSFTVEQDFYIVAHLPYSIKRGEVAAIQVMIYNFVGNELITDVYLYNKNDEIEFVDQASSDNTRRSKAVTMPRKGGRQVTFLIKAKKIGEIAVKIEAINSLKQDSVEHILRVDPESHLFDRNEARYIDHDTYKNSNFSLQIDIPKKIINGSEKIEFALDPSFLRIAIKNVNNLIHTPKEYGEANMIGFVPQALILDYISENGITDEVLKNELMNYLKTGYHNQMKYKLDDGSFGVWSSEKHKKGSIFITSLVAKSFKIASKHDDRLVDKDIVVAALRWIASKQNADGSFTEEGDKIHTELQGVYRPSSYALTAYVLAAFYEVGELASETSLDFTSAINYLVNNHHKINDLYDLALTAYALSLKKHDMGKKCLDKLIEESVNENGERYWNKDPFSTEIASYTALAFFQYHPVIEATNIITWLTKKRTGTGGFSSIQDTFVGLQAMAQYAAKTSVKSYDYTITLRWNKLLAKTFSIGSHNAHDVHVCPVPPNVRKIEVEINGIGIGMFQAAYQYRRELEDAKKGFELNLLLMDSSTYHVQHLRVCTKYLQAEHYTTSNLAYVEVFFPSGLHVKDESSVIDLASTNRIRNIELYNRGTNVRVFYNTIGEFESCFKITAERRYNVALHRPAYVVVYDSVDKTKFAIKQYDGIINQPCDICEDEDCETMACNNAK